MNVLIVDDEPLARQRMRRLLSDFPEYAVVGEAENGEQALALSQSLNPDVVLLDIRMPGMDGIEVATQLASYPEPPAVIFCTAYDDYALDAFSAKAVDYLVKPVAAEKLGQALQRAQTVNKAQLASMRETEPKRKHVSVKLAGATQLIPLDAISHLFAEQKYVSVFYDGGEALLDEPLKELEQSLGDAFVRVHRNALVSVRHIEGLQPQADGGQRVVLRGVEVGPLVSRRLLASVRKLIKAL